MANSRLEKIGTIYARTKGLLQSGALNYYDRPLWYDVYESFPPNEDPRFDRPAPNLKIKEIFFKEDKIKALQHANLRQVGVINLLNSYTPSFSQRFTQTYQQLETQYGEGKCEARKLLEETVELLKKERQLELVPNESAETEGLTAAFKTVSSLQKETTPSPSISVKNIFQE